MKHPKFHIQPLRVKGLYFVVDRRGLHQRTAQSIKQAKQYIVDLLAQFTSRSMKSVDES